MKSFDRCARVSGPMIVALVASVYATDAHAQCAFNSNAKATKISLALVRAYTECPDGVVFPATNSSNMFGVPSCAAPSAVSSYKYEASKGGCKLGIKAKALPSCVAIDPGNTGSCQSTAISLKCSGLLDASNLPDNSSGWTLALVTRWTTVDPVNGDMTLIDFPFWLPAAPPPIATVNGKLSLKADLAAVFTALYGPGGSAWSGGCTNTELLSVVLRDPSGLAFAVPGVSTR